MTDLKDTIAALSAKATPGVWEHHPVRGHSHDEVFARSTDGEALCICADGNADYRDAPFIIALVNAYRSGQLVPVPSAEAAAEMVAQLRKLARKQEGYGMSFSDPSPRAGGMTSINLYGDRAKAAIWLFKNADRIADAVLAAMKGEGKP